MTHHLQGTKNVEGHADVVPPFPSFDASPLRIVHRAVDGRQGRELSIANHNQVVASGLETEPAWIRIELKYRALSPPLIQDCSQSVRPSVPLPHPHTQQTFTRLIKQTGRGSSSADTDGRDAGRDPERKRGRERKDLQTRLKGRTRQNRRPNIGMASSLFPHSQ